MSVRLTWWDNLLIFYVFLFDVVALAVIDAVWDVITERRRI